MGTSSSSISTGARPQAPKQRAVDSVKTVGRGTAHLDSQLFFQNLADVRSPLDMAGCAQAEIDDVVADGIEAEKVVKSDHTEHFGQRDIEFAGHKVLDFQRQVAENLLGPVQYLNQRPGNVAISFDEFFQLR